MATSNLSRTGEKGPVTTKGHGTGALGPSDTSDSGSDIRGGPGVVEDSELGLDSGTLSDPGSELADEVDEVTHQTDVELGPREVPRPRAPVRKKRAKAHSAKTK